ncbi:hypothetical protein CsatA_012962 [Cannabis sativa]
MKFGNTETRGCLFGKVEKEPNQVFEAVWEWFHKFFEVTLDSPGLHRLEVSSSFVLGKYCMVDGSDKNGAFGVTAARSSG